MSWDMAAGGAAANNGNVARSAATRNMHRVLRRALVQ